MNFLELLLEVSQYIHTQWSNIFFHMIGYPTYGNTHETITFLRLTFVLTNHVTLKYFAGLPDKRLYPSISAVYGNTEVSMVYLGPPLDGWAYHSLVFITNKYSYWYLATIWSLSPDNLEKFDSIRTLKIWRIWKTVWCSYISKQICELKLDIFFKVIALPEEIFYLNLG